MFHSIRLLCVSAPLRDIRLPTIHAGNVRWTGDASDLSRVHLRDELFDIETGRVRSDKLFLIGRMAAPHWYCRTRDRFEMIRPA